MKHTQTHTKEEIILPRKKKIDIKKNKNARNDRNG